MMIGESEGLIFLYVGRLGRFAGSWPADALMAACTSRAAASISRFKSNCNVIDVEPARLLDVISVTPEILLNCRSSGVATDEAMISGLAPGSAVLTEIVGKSTCGSGATGSLLYAIAPAIRIPAVSRDVAIGRRINGAEMFMFVWQTRSQSAVVHFRKD